MKRRSRFVTGDVVAVVQREFQFDEERPLYGTSGRFLHYDNNDPVWCYIEIKGKAIKTLEDDLKLL